jgi:hypothetical protein
MRCAIHQPNFLPRLSTLAKLYAADCVVILDDVQFTRRDYQHRCRLAPLHDPADWHWLSLPTHLPKGRATLIKQARLVDTARSRRKVEGTLLHYYGQSSYWPQISVSLQDVLDLTSNTDSLADITTASTRCLLDLVGWRGTVVCSSDLTASSERSERLADLTQAVGANDYLCGTGGMRYIEHEPFTERGLTVVPFRPPSTGDMWRTANRLSSLWALMLMGPEWLNGALEGLVRSPSTRNPTTCTRDNKLS